MNHPTTKPKEKNGISEISDITQWEENILKILVRTDEATKSSLLRGTLYDTDRLERSIDSLCSRDLIGKVGDDDERTLYQYMGTDL